MLYTYIEAIANKIISTAIILRDNFSAAAKFCIICTLS